MEYFIKVFALAAIVGYVYCTINGLTYMDELKLQPSKLKDYPCNPLYWYPKHLPDFCYHNDTLPPRPPPQPIPVPVPVQLPPVGVFQPIPPLPPSPPQLSYPYLPPGPPDPCACPPCPPPPVPLYPLPPPPPVYCACPMCPVMPVPVAQAPEIPFGVPIAPTYPMIPVSGVSHNPYSAYYASLYRKPMVGMVPGLPGIVSDDGGINVMPFSDAYSDLMEKHKNKEFRNKYRRLINRLDGRYRSRSRRY